VLQTVNLSDLKNANLWLTLFLLLVIVSTYRYKIVKSQCFLSRAFVHLKSATLLFIETLKLRDILPDCLFLFFTLKRKFATIFLLILIFVTAKCSFWTVNTIIYLTTKLNYRTDWKYRLSQIIAGAEFIPFELHYVHPAKTLFFCF
jgi:hypothetical protein